MPDHNKHFYRAFEDKYRGSRELIKQRLCAYLPFVCPLASLNPGLPVIDLGCGRGEWLELLRDHQITAHGVDIDAGMLEASRKNGLSVSNADILEYLKNLPDQSQLAVTGFHIAEHLPFPVLQTLIAEAHRVLVAGGLLILETPNPENLLVGAANFYIDPTHQRPLPSQLLVFLAEYQGFDPVKLLCLQEEPRLAANGPVSLYDVIANVSPDYAIVAQIPFTHSRPGVPEQSQPLLQEIAHAFAIDRGVTLNALAIRYDQQLQQSAQCIQGQIEAHRGAIEAEQQRTEEVKILAQRIGTQSAELEERIKQVSTQNSQVTAQLEERIKQVSTQNSQVTAQLEERIKQVSTQSSQVAAELEERIRVILTQTNQLATQLESIYKSRSWRITRPLRWLAGLIRRKSARH